MARIHAEHDGVFLEAWTHASTTYWKAATLDGVVARGELQGPEGSLDLLVAGLPALAEAVRLDEADRLIEDVCGHIMCRADVKTPEKGTRQGRSKKGLLTASIEGDCFSWRWWPFRGGQPESGACPAHLYGGSQFSDLISYLQELLEDGATRTEYPSGADFSRQLG